MPVLGHLKVPLLLSLFCRPFVERLLLRLACEQQASAAAVAHTCRTVGPPSGFRLYLAERKDEHHLCWEEDGANHSRHLSRLHVFAPH